VGWDWGGGGGGWVGGDNSWGTGGGSDWGSGGSGTGSWVADRSVESVPSRQGHIQGVGGKVEEYFSDENGVDVASFGGTCVSVNSGTSG